MSNGTSVSDRGGVVFTNCSTIGMWLNQWLQERYSVSLLLIQLLLI